jgi:hypothetical protein
LPNSRTGQGRATIPGLFVFAGSGRAGCPAGAGLATHRKQRRAQSAPPGRYRVRPPRTGRWVCTPGPEGSRPSAFNSPLPRQRVTVNCPLSTDNCTPEGSRRLPSCLREGRAQRPGEGTGHTKPGEAKADTHSAPPGRYRVRPPRRGGGFAGRNRRARALPLSWDVTRILVAARRKPSGGFARRDRRARGFSPSRCEGGSGSQARGGCLPVVADSMAGHTASPTRPLPRPTSPVGR